MRQTHDVVGGARRAMSGLADNLMVLITAGYPPAVILTTLMGEAALAFPGLRDPDLMKVIDHLLRAEEYRFAPSSKVIRFPKHHAIREAAGQMQ